MARLLTSPDAVDRLRSVARVAVAARLEAGMSDEAIMARGVSAAIEAARLEGCDAEEIEVAASIARRNIAEALAEQWGEVPEGFR